MATVIKVENLSKKYIIQHQKQARNISLREVIAEKTVKFGNGVKNIFRASQRCWGPACEEFWALKDIDFEIKKGECVGVIGYNGAGKTTLLKILSRITEPTRGRVYIKGKVSSLLEVGTGFHPELTGRENIFLNGVIMGMRKAEIKKKFDDIVSFAEFEKFIDTPVKRYSTGMYVRLAFAVGAYLEPDILLVDEVLAVGDLAFQKKCIGKMDDVTVKEGRTILFVSHNMQMVKQLCQRGILLDKGKILKIAPIDEALQNYFTLGADASRKDRDLANTVLRKSISLPQSIFKWTHIKILNAQKEVSSELRFYEPFEIVLRGEAGKECRNINIGFNVALKMGEAVFSGSQIYAGLPDNLPEGISEFRIEINPNVLAPGYYQVNLGATAAGVGDFIDAALEFTVVDIGFTPDKVWDSRYHSGVIDRPCSWSLKTNLPEK